ncbi:DsbA family protein [Sesbania bispinosa]|nr:DsbA family protein [Sesbania bispinosa]
MDLAHAMHSSGRATVEGDSYITVGGETEVEVGKDTKIALEVLKPPTTTTLILQSLRGTKFQLPRDTVGEAKTLYQVTGPTNTSAVHKSKFSKAHIG